MYTSLLAWRERRYLWWALGLILLSVGLYSSEIMNPGQPPNGGTWQGYVLGTLGALMIFWLSMLGVRKRRYRSTLGTVEGWTSAHVYLGLALIVVATLHCAAQFGWNVHTLAYVLMVGVIVSGIHGLYVYMHLPQRMAANRAGRDREAWIEELTEIDQKIADLAQRCDAEVQGMVMSALELTGMGRSLRDRLAARDTSRVVLPDGSTVSNRGQAVVLERLASRVPDARKQAEAEVLNEVLGLCGRRQVVLERLRQDARLLLHSRIWLWFHIPLTVTLLVALTIHIISVFIYW
jgi:hypothetical protein